VDPLGTWRVRRWLPPPCPHRHAAVFMAWWFGPGLGRGPGRSGRTRFPNHVPDACCGLGPTRPLAQAWGARGRKKAHRLGVGLAHVHTHIRDGRRVRSQPRGNEGLAGGSCASMRVPPPRKHNLIYTRCAAALPHFHFPRVVFALSFPRSDDGRHFTVPCARLHIMFSMWRGSVLCCRCVYFKGWGLETVRRAEPGQGGPGPG
jgi:hypothetical protein